MRRTVGHYATWTGVLSALLTAPCSLRDICIKSGVDYETIRPLVNELHKEGLLHITAWRRDKMNRASIAVYSLGFGVDAKKPAAKPAVVRTAAYKNRKQAADEDKLFAPAGLSTISNAMLDTTMRSWI